jgi:hypothetical protein
MLITALKMAEQKFVSSCQIFKLLRDFVFVPLFVLMEAKLQSIFCRQHMKINKLILALDCVTGRGLNNQG